MYKITVFHALKTSGKAPISPFEDNTFVFENYDVQTNLQMFSVMTSHYILNIPLAEMKRPERLRRRKDVIGKYVGQFLNYFILDIDGVKSEFDRQKVIEYFRDYKVILGESRSYNGIDNFNMKGVLFVEDIDVSDAKLAIQSLQADLGDICVVDESASRVATLNAPILKNRVFYNNEDGILYKFVKTTIQETIARIQSQYITSDSKDPRAIDLKEIERIEADSMERLCLRVFMSMGYEAIKTNPNGSISFRHPSEVKSPGGYFWFGTAPYTMHHGNSTKSINIFDIVRKLPAAKDLMRKEIDYDKEFLRVNAESNILQVDQKFLTVTDEVRKTVDAFINNKNGLLSIRSPMGTGKSTIIHHIIDECHSSDMKVLVVTNRISVAKDFGKKYSMKVYNQDKYEIGDSLVCQYDSLWKYNVKFFDVVIMDEFISLLLHSRSNLNTSSINIAKFFGCFNKKLVIADAFLTGYEQFLLSNKTSNLHVIDNHYRDPTTLYSYDDHNFFVQSVVASSTKAKAAGSKITVSSTSLSFIHSMQLLLEGKGLRVQTLTADTPDTTKELVYQLFEKDDHDKWDVLMYSPTLTVGVSNLNATAKHFHYDSSASTDVISSIQMLKRTRKSKEVHIYVKERMNYVKTSYNDLRDEYMSGIGKVIDQNYLFEVDDYGEARLSDIGKRAIKIDVFRNILEFDHRKAFMWLLQWHFKHNPREISDKFAGNVLTKYQKALSADKRILSQMQVSQFLRLSDIERTSLLQDAGADRALVALAQISERVQGCSSEDRETILNRSLIDMNFLNKCKNYGTLKQYSTGDLDDTDIRHRISKAVIRGDSDELHFLNVLLDTQFELKDEYLPKEVTASRNIKYLLEQSGYSLTKISNPGVVGHRGFRCDADVNRLWMYVE